MTAQTHETLIYNGEKLGMATLPLNDYLNTLSEKPVFVSPHTANWRGYHGTWEIKNNMLFLIAFRGFVKDGKEVGLDYLFPGQTEVFAYWFSDEVRIPQGEQLHYVHMGWESVYEKDLFLCFEKGKLINSRVEDNIESYKAKLNAPRIYKKTKNSFLARTNFKLK